MTIFIGPSCAAERSLTQCLKLDTMNKYAFVADYGGVITVLKLDPNNFQEVTSLRGHQSIECVVHKMSVVHFSCCLRQC